MSGATTPGPEATSTNTPSKQPGVLVTVLVTKRHHLPVRWSHWPNVPILLGLILSCISIYRELRRRGGYWNLDMRLRARAASLHYWASPIYQHKPDPISSPPDWVYNHMSLGPGMLAAAWRLHWLCAYAFMLKGAVYVAGLIAGGGWRGLLPRRTDLFDAFSPPSMATSQFQRKVQRAPARQIFHYSDRRVPFGNHGLGDSQAHAVPFAGCDLCRIRCDARLAFLAHVGLHPLRRTSRDSGWVPDCSCRTLLASLFVSMTK